MSDIRILTAGSSEFERDIPLNPILEALSRPDVGEVVRTLEDPWRQVLLSLMPELHEGPGPLPEIPQVRPGSLPRRLFEAIRQVFLAVAAEGPLVLFLDDFHWADDTSIAALEYLRRRWEGGGLCIVLAIRPEDLLGEGAAARFIQSVEPLEEAVEIEVGDLSEEGVHSLIRTMAAGRLSERQMESVASLGGRSPFFLIELTMEALEGRDFPVDERPELTPIPLSIRQLLAHRLAGLSEPAEHVLGLLAAFGLALPDNELRDLSELSGERFVASIEALQTLRLVERSEGGIRIRHELIRQTIYSRFSDARRAFTHERIAQFLLLSWNPIPADKLALHFDRAGARNEACTYATQAADVAQAAGAISEAVRFLALARQNTSDPSTATEIVWRLAHLNYLQRNLSEAGPLLELAASRLRGQGRSIDALEAEAEKLDTLASLGAIPEEDLLSEVYRLKDTAKQEGAWSIVATLLDTAIHIHNRSNSFGAVRQCLDELETYLYQGNDEAKVHIRSALFPHVYFGEPSKGVAFSREAVKLAEELGQKDLWLKAVNRHLVTTLAQGLFNVENSISLIRKAQQAAEVSGDLMIKCRLHSNLGVWRLDEGNHVDAIAELHRAFDVLRDTEAPQLKVNLYYNMGEAYYLTGNVEESYKYFSMAQDVISPATPGYYADLLQVGLALCELFRGHLATALKIEQSIRVDEEHWSYDPTLYILFKKKLLLRRGRQQEVVDMLEYFISALSDRFPTQVLHLKIDLADILQTMPKGRNKRAVALLQEVFEIATARELRILAAEARGRLRRIGSAHH